MKKNSLESISELAKYIVHMIKSPGVRLIFSLVSIYYVFQIISLETLTLTLLAIDADYLIAAILLNFIIVLASAYRFWLICCIFNSSLKFLYLFKVNYIGLWLNQVLPTSLGGDLFKVGYLRNFLGVKQGTISIIYDRLLGLFFLCLMLLINLPFFLDFSGIFEVADYFKYIFIFCSLTFLSVVFLFFWIYSRRSTQLPLSKSGQKVKNLATFLKPFFQLGVLVKMVIATAFLHFGGIATFVLIGKSLGVQVPLHLYFLLVPLVFFVALMPISYGGWGLRELSSLWLFGFVGLVDQDALALSIVYGFVLLVVSVPGVLMLLFRGQMSDV